MPASEVRTFTDPDDWTTFRGSQAELTITARGQFSAKLTWIRLHRLQVQRFFDNLPRILHVAHVHRRATISFLAPQGPPQRWGGTELAPGDIMLHNLDQSHFQQTSGFASSGFMSLPVEDFVSAGATMVGCDLTPPKDPLVFRPPFHALTKLRRLHAAAGHLAETAPEIIANPDAAYGLEQALIEVMVGCLDNNEAREDSVAQRQHELIMRRFRRVVEENADQPLYIPELCRAIGVSQRTLQVCCQEQLGVGPKRYLLFRRLHLARRALRAGLPTTVTEIATRYGFWHFGRFAGEYQSLFGEPPSSTLHRQPNRGGIYLRKSDSASLGPGPTIGHTSRRHVRVLVPCQEEEHSMSSSNIRDGSNLKDRAVSRRNLLLSGTTLAAATAVGPAAAVKTAQAQRQPVGRRPNILVIFGDDIGMWNVGAYCNGMMGRTPNIDRIAKEGILFTDHYGQPSCTAGRAAFIMGQLPVRTGMTTVGIPGSTRGIQKSDPTLAEVLKAEGYATAQFGKNHLGDRNEFLPTVHGFDYWFGNLYHLNAEEEPEELDYPGQKNPQYKQRFGPRGVLRAFATDVDDPTTDPKFGRVGKQKIEDTGPLTRKRMETIDSEVLGETLKWMDTNGKGDKPFFVWFNSTAIHIWSHPTQKYIQMAVDEGRAEEDVVRARMLEHDEHVGALLKKLDDLGIANNTIVVYTTDNGNELLFWPDGGYAPFRGEKGTTWEGGVRVPCVIRWPGTIPAGRVSNEVQAHEDLYASLAAAAGRADLKEKLLGGLQLGPTTYKVHLDGYNNLDLWSGKTEKSARREFFYYDETDLMGLRVDNWKLSFGVKNNGLWWDAKAYPSVPYVFNLRMDPMEKIDPESHEWGYAGRKFVAQKLWAPTAAGPFLAAHLQSLNEFPPSQGADTLSMKKAVDSAMAKVSKHVGE